MNAQNRHSELLPLVLLSFALIITATGSQAAPGNKTQSEIVTRSQCPPGDPMCVEAPSQRKATPSPKTTPPAEAKTGQAEKQVTSAEAMAAADSAVKKGAASRAPQVRHVPTTEGQPASGLVSDKKAANGWEYVFGDDAASAEAGCAADRIRARPKIKVPLPCFDPYWEIVKNPGSSIPTMRAAFVRFVQCQDHCITDEDARFLANCIDFEKFKKLTTSPEGLDFFDFTSGKMSEDDSLNFVSCSEEKKKIGALAGRYSGSRTNPTTGKCDVKYPVNEAKRFAKKLYDEFKEDEVCPESIVETERWGNLAKKIHPLGDVNQVLPSPGSNLLVCNFHAQALRYVEEDWTFNPNGTVSFRSLTGSSGCRYHFYRKPGAKGWLVPFAGDVWEKHRDNELQPLQCAEGYKKLERTRYIPFGNKVWLVEVTYPDGKSFNWALAFEKK